jgi:hypothetical protein
MITMMSDDTGNYGYVELLLLYFFYLKRSKTYCSLYMGDNYITLLNTLLRPLDFKISRVKRHQRSVAGSSTTRPTNPRSTCMKWSRCRK